MSGEFKKFQSLPWEIQVMIFEDFLLQNSPEKPRVVILHIEEVPSLRLTSGDYLEQSGVKVTNWGQLLAEGPDSVARSLLDVCSSSREAAIRFPGCPEERPFPPHHRIKELLGLGLSLTRDFIWFPDDMLELTIVQENIPYYNPVYFPEGEGIENAIISIQAVETAMDLTNRMREDDVDIDDMGPGLHLAVDELFKSFEGLRQLVVMVDVPRQHVSWDKIQIVKPDDPALLTLAGETGRERCLSVLRAYEALSVQPHDSESDGNDSVGDGSDSGSDGSDSASHDNDSDGGIDFTNFHNLQEMSLEEMIYREEIASDSNATWNDGYENESDWDLYEKEEWPQLSFGFLKPSSLPTSSPDIVS